MIPLQARRPSPAQIVVWCTLLCCAGLFAQSDTEPPQLLSLSISPATVDVTASGQTVAVTAHVRDNLSGLDTSTPFLILVRLISPSGRQSAVASVPYRTDIILDLMAPMPVPIPRYAEPGVWRIESFRLRDNVGNTIILRTADLTALGFPTAVTVADTNPDTEPPQLTGIRFRPPAVDVSTAPQTMTADILATDDRSGVITGRVTLSDFELRSPSGKQAKRLTINEFMLVSGTVNNGTWRASLTMPRYSEPGVWKLASVRLTDNLDTSRFYTETDLDAFGSSTELIVVSSNPDTVAPQLIGLSLSRLAVDTSRSSQTVNTALSITDNVAGVSFVTDTPRFPIAASDPYGAIFVSPSGAQRQTTFTGAEAPPIGGTPNNGLWSLTLTLPQFSEQGSWKLHTLRLKDTANNVVSYSTSKLAALGFPTEIAVIRPTLEPDGTVGASGGTVVDATFGSRAQVTFPPGTLPGNTGIAVDVLTSPPDIPDPTGFSAGTFFTSLILSPVPPMPFASPGISLVLPMSTFKAPGTNLVLFRLDSVTGSLVPAISVNGGNVTGTVNADGLSATFRGVGSLSIVVGFIANTVLGDVDGNGLVNCEDVAIVKASFGKRTGQPGFDARADLNRDGVVNVIDMTIVVRQLRTICR